MFSPIDLMSITIDMMTSMSVLLISFLLLKFLKEYTQENNSKRIERTLIALQFPKNIQQTLFKIIYKDDEIYLNEKDRDFSIEVFNALAFFENLASGIWEGVYDDKLVFSRFGDVLPRFYFTVAKEIYIARSEGESLSSFIQLERLARKWKDKRFSASGDF